MLKKLSLLLALGVVLVGCSSRKETLPEKIEDRTAKTDAAIENIVEQVSAPEPVKEDDNVSSEFKAALGSAKNYLSIMAFSEGSLKTQLEFEKFPADAIDYALANVDADWNSEAMESAKNYLSIMAFSDPGLRTQLEFEKFTPEQIDYAMNNITVDWNAEALESAKNYQSSGMNMSRQGIADQLDFEGYTTEQIKYAMDNLPQ